VPAMRAALDEELDNPAPLLPASPVVPALQERKDDVAEWAYAQVNGSFNPAPQEVVAVSKSRHGIRPVAMWDLPSRLLYRALTAELTEGLDFQERSSSAWRRFQRSPLSSRGRGYVIAADIASCYELIDHSLLGQELLVQTGNHHLVDALTKLLRETSGRTYGLPQQCSASDLLAEIFLDKLERALLRRGLTVTRYSDDFRLTCSSWSEVVWAIETLTEEARNHGLILNDSKLLTWGRAAYRNHLDEADELRERIAADAQLDLESIYSREEYPGQFGTPEMKEDEFERTTAVRILERWVEVAGHGRVSDDKRAEHRALLQLLPIAFSALSTNKHYDNNEVSLSIAMQLLRYEQTMTPHVSRFLMTRDIERQVLLAFNNLLTKRAYLTGWQTWWLQHALSKLPSFILGRGGKTRRTWVEDAYSSAERSPVLRAQAAITMARHELIEADDLLRVYDRSSPVIRPVVVAAIAMRRPKRSMARAVTGDSQLNRWLFEWASTDA
jgi:RNA-directed DNA polymerase